ncbi:glucokinase [Caulobacter sp. 17J80-11]|uniref:glucokinase n=1 Tax=Caulobacter sp. 17J80-11 TaxID=2763502 RepID=UPI001653ECBA|nr:glucokinase [Caulobacter sp. 17J80-11]MBC6983112.1 glucokinase [Caulobacter sp. 17J80-11]
MTDDGGSLDPAGLGLVGDIGGTNARFGLVRVGEEPPEVMRPRAYVGRDFASVEQAIDTYLATVRVRRPSMVALAVAGPVRDGVIHFTNLDKTLSEADLRGHGFREARLLNDYAALAMAALCLGGGDLRQIGGPSEAPPGRTVAVAGPGTGFGASALVRRNGQAVPLSGEAGHTSFAPQDEVELEVLRILKARFGRVSVERILSGQGLVNLHAALARIDGRDPGDLSPAAITDKALEGDAPCLATVERFCAILGDVLGDYALAVGAEGGVYIGGGIAPRILPVLERSDFRARFESKGRFVDYMRAIPTWLIVHPLATLLGAAEALSELARGR